MKFLSVGVQATLTTPIKAPLIPQQTIAFRLVCIAKIYRIALFRRVCWEPVGVRFRKLIRLPSRQLDSVLSRGCDRGNALYRTLSTSADEWTVKLELSLAEGPPVNSDLWIWTFVREIWLVTCVRSCTKPLMVLDYGILTNNPRRNYYTIFMLIKTRTNVFRRRAGGIKELIAGAQLNVYLAKIFLFATRQVLPDMKTSLAI